MPDGPAPRTTSDRLTQVMQRAKLTQDPLGDALVFIHEAREDFRATAADMKAVARSREPVPPEAVERAARAIAKRAGQIIAQARWWAVAGAMGCVAVLSLGVGYGIGRYELTGEVERVEIGLGQTMTLSTASGYLEIMRNNPGGLVLSQREAQGGRKVGSAVMWLEPQPAPVQQAKR